MAYGQIYSIPSVNIFGVSCDLKIKRNGYTGAVTELQGAKDPYVGKMEGDGDTLEETIKRRKFTIRIDVETENELVELRSLFTSNWKEYIAELWKGGSLYWIGWMSVDYWSEPWTAPPLAIQLEMYDGLAQLKSMDYVDPDTGARLREVYSHASIISDILQRVDPGILGIYEAIDIFEKNQSTDDAIVKHIGVDRRLFSHSGIMKCYEVLESILEIYNAEIWQENGYWHIVSRGRKKASYTRRLYDFDWVEQSSGSFDPVVSKTSHTAENAVFFWETPKMEMIPGWKELIVNHDLNYKTNLFEPWARRYTIGDPDYTVYDEGQSVNRAYIGDAARGIIDCPYYIVAIKDTRTAIMGWTIGIFEKVTNQYLKISFNYEAKPNNAAFYIFMWQTSTNKKYYLGNSGEWSDVRRTCWFPTSEKTLEIETDELPFDGRLHFELHVYENPGRSHIDMILADQECIMFEMKQAYLVENIEVTTTINEDHNLIPETFEIIMGDLPDVENADDMYLGGLWRDDAGTWVLTEEWFHQDSPAVLRPLIYILSDQIAVQHVRPIKWISGVIHGEIFNGCSILDGHADAIFEIMRVNSEDVYDGNWDVDLIEIAPESQGYLNLKQGGRLLLKSGGKIKIK